jgi:hypothetical protein
VEETIIRTLFGIERADGKAWAHNGAQLGDREYFWSSKPQHPCTWPTRRGADMALHALQEHGGEGKQCKVVELPAPERAD